MKRLISFLAITIFTTACQSATSTAKPTATVEILSTPIEVTAMVTLTPLPTASPTAEVSPATAPAGWISPDSKLAEAGPKPEGATDITYDSIAKKNEWSKPNPENPNNPFYWKAEAGGG